MERFGWLSLKTFACKTVSALISLTNPLFALAQKLVHLRKPLILWTIVTCDKMHKSFSLVEKTGEQLSESFSFGLNITKSRLINLLKVEGANNEYPPRQEWKSIIGPVSFNEGLLKNVRNTFELRILSDLTRVDVYYPESLERKKYGIYISEMKLSLLADEGKKFQADLFDESDNLREGKLPGHRHAYPSPKGHYNFFTMIKNETNQWCDGGLRRDKLNLLTWPSSVNELRIDIIIKQNIKPKYTESENVVPTCNVPKPKWLTDPSKYFLSAELSDVSIHCQGTTFPAHIMILACHSPVFAKMFEHEMRETRERCVGIENVDPNIFSEMLRYFYTGGVENLEHNAMELYNLADRYLVDNLKLMCIRALVQSVKMENAVEIYYFGRMKEIPALTEKATRVLISNKKNIVRDDVSDVKEFLNVTLEVPKNLKNDLFRLLWDN